MPPFSCFLLLSILITKKNKKQKNQGMCRSIEFHFSSSYLFRRKVDETFPGPFWKSGKE